MSKHSQSFLERMDEAAFWETYVSTLLSRAGLYVLHYPTDIDPNGPDAHGDSIDLEVYPHAGSLWHGTPVEVKSVNFMDPVNPILCSQNNYLKKHGKACDLRTDFLFVLRKTGQVLWLPQGSELTFGHDQLDSTRNELYKVVKFRSKDLRSVGDFVTAMKGGD